MKPRTWVSSKKWLPEVDPEIYISGFIGFDRIEDELEVDPSEVPVRFEPYLYTVGQNNVVIYPVDTLKWNRYIMWDKHIILADWISKNYMEGVGKDKGYTGKIRHRIRQWAVWELTAMFLRVKDDYLNGKDYDDFTIDDPRLMRFTINEEGHLIVSYNDYKKSFAYYERNDKDHLIATYTQDPTKIAVSVNDEGHAIANKV